MKQDPNNEHIFKKKKMECKNTECNHSVHWHDKFGCVRGGCGCSKFIA